MDLKVYDAYTNNGILTPNLLTQTMLSKKNYIDLKLAEVVRHISYMEKVYKELWDFSKSNKATDEELLTEGL